MAGVAHLARRFVGSLRPGGPPPGDVAWVAAQLLPDELVAWSSMPAPDRRHSVLVARRVAHHLGTEATRPVLAAALLHDVGKAQSGLRTPGRVLATLVAAVAGRPRAQRWRDGRGYARRIGRYLTHDRLGADRLERAGSDPLTVAWTREHHLPEAEWTVPRHLADALKAADDD